ncbi:hypothetical protein LC613_25265 [Nostoc sphaeroides CHAB 2801]|uniref:hypothetical protein n=1 Tax=Nostoc sphaeroides TaxID=446679 RepID=UPI0011C17FCA|nr:hypothetical protein [Nostoc sphaeroides]MCC5631117.1 hypothetical protein [Nostoc sphaeroides CHAB 2801]
MSGDLAVTAGNQQGRTTGNKETATSGATKPNKDGPSIIPATISPITSGCLSLFCHSPGERSLEAS